MSDIEDRLKRKYLTINKHLWKLDKQVRTCEIAIGELWRELDSLKKEYKCKQ